MRTLSTNLRRHALEMSNYFTEEIDKYEGEIRKWAARIHVDPVILFATILVGSFVHKLALDQLQKAGAKPCEEEHYAGSVDVVIKRCVDFNRAKNPHYANWSATEMVRDFRASYDMYLIFREQFLESNFSA
jgi:hypothetical protein